MSSEPGTVMDALFADWDAERSAPSSEVREWAEEELDRAVGAQQARGV